MQQMVTCGCLNVAQETRDGHEEGEHALLSNDDRSDFRLGFGWWRMEAFPVTHFRFITTEVDWSANKSQIQTGQKMGPLPVSK